MADELEVVIPVSCRRMTTFTIQGGRSFALQPEYNPSLEHDGGLTVWHGILNSNEVTMLEAQIKMLGCSVNTHSDTLNDLQRAEKRLRLTGLKDEVFPCPKCMDCHFMDLKAEGFCGVESWEPERLEVSMATSWGKRDRLACPLDR